MRISLLTLLLPLGATAAPSPQQAFDQADLTACAQQTAHPEDPLRVSVVLFPDGARAVAALPGTTDLPPEAVYECLSEALESSFAGVKAPKEPLLLSRVVGDSSVALGDALDGAVSTCAVALPPGLDRVSVRVRVVSAVGKPIDVRATQPTPGSGPIVTCLREALRKALRGFTVEPARVERDLTVERPGAPPRHDGRLGAVCAWGEGGGPRPTPCRKGLVCRACSGGIQRLDGEEVDSHCALSNVPCPRVP